MLQYRMSRPLLPCNYISFDSSACLHASATLRYARLPVPNLPCARAHVPVCLSTSRRLVRNVAAAPWGQGREGEGNTVTTSLVSLVMPTKSTPCSAQGAQSAVSVGCRGGGLR